MKYNERLDKFLQLQSKNLKFDEIAKEIGIAPSTLRKFLNKAGYKSVNSKYILDLNKENQIMFEQIKEKDNKEKSKKVSIKKNISKKNTLKLNNKKSDSKIVVSKSKATKAKQDKRINITQDDLDKLCEVYDWYMQVKDYKSMKPKNISKKKDVLVEELEMKEVKSTSIKVDKSVWEEFERLCSNSEFNKQQIITQALKDFMKEYKHLL